MATTTSICNNLHAILAVRRLTTQASEIVCTVAWRQRELLLMMRWEILNWNVCSAILHLPMLLELIGKPHLLQLCMGWHDARRVHRWLRLQSQNWYFMLTGAPLGPATA